MSDAERRVPSSWVLGIFVIIGAVVGGLVAAIAVAFATVVLAVEADDREDSR